MEKIVCVCARDNLSTWAYVIHRMRYYICAWKRGTLFLAQWSLFKQIGSAQSNCAEKKVWANLSIKYDLNHFISPFNQTR